MNIGLLISHYNGSEYSYNVCKYVKEQCSKHNIGLFIYEGRHFLSEDINDKQHNVVYNLISDKTIDGIISITPNLARENAFDQYLKFLEKQNIPIISVGLEIPNFISVVSNNTTGMEQLMQHLVKEHSDRKNYAFLSGPAGNIEAKLRYEVFKKILNDNNITFQTSNFFKSDFTSPSGYKAAKKMINKIKNHEIDVVVSANDEMAFGAIKCFRENNIVIPDDVIITGYDDLKYSTTYEVSTVRQPLEAMAQKAVELLYEIHTTKVLPSEKLYTFDSYCITRGSCSCKSTVEVQKNIDINFFQGTFEKIQTFKIPELYNRLNNIFKEHNITDFFIVRYQDTSNTYYTLDNIAEKSKIVYGLCNSKNIEYDKEFDTIDTLPKLILKKLQSKNLIIKPLFFEYEHFGYFVSKCEDYDIQLIEDLCPVISNAIMGSKLLEKQQTLVEHLAHEYDKILFTEKCLNETIQQLNEVNNKLHGVAERDELTNVLNRYGILNKIKEEINDEPFYLVFCDMDGLKKINDTYGHDEGDFAIKEMAMLLQETIRTDSNNRNPDLVARMGGDEFIVIIRDANNETIYSIDKRLTDNLIKYNEKLNRLGKKWALSFSWGCLKGNGVNDFIEVQRQADTLMYNRKKEKKCCRDS